MAQDNKERVEALKRELAILARQSKQQTAFTGVVSQSPVVDSSVLDALREHLNELQNQQEKLAIATGRQHSEVIGDLSRKQVGILYWEAAWLSGGGWTLSSSPTPTIQCIFPWIVPSYP